MQPRTIQAPAKINLSLRITRRRPDGYHELESLFAPVPGLFDTLELSPAPEGCSIEPGIPGLAAEDNLIYRAWASFGQATGFRPGLRVGLTKRIPSGAGLGGGSSDAAAMLLWLNAGAGERALYATALNALAARLGADVPFFLLGGPAWATGIGEVLTPVELDLSPFTLVLVTPDIHVPTPWAYGRWDELHPEAALQNDREELLTTGHHANMNRSSLLPMKVRNDFEMAVFPEYPRLRRIKETLLGLGAACCAMSGSGSSLFALFREPERAQTAIQAMRTEGAPVHSEALRHWGVAKR